MKKSNPFFPANKSVIEVMILYDDFSSAARVGVALRRAAYRARADEQLNINTCRVDMLKLPGAGEDALREAAGAHLIVFAGSFVQCLASWLQAWLERWAERRQVHDVALAIIGHESANLTPAKAAPELSRFARRHGLNFIFNYRIANQGGPALFMSQLKEHGLPLLPAPQRNVDLTITDSRPRWSINE